MSFPRPLLAAALLIFGASVWAQSAPSEQQIQKQIAPTVQALSRALFNWQMAGTRGLTVEAKELSTKPAPGGTLAGYALYTHGFPPGVHLQLLVWLITQSGPMPGLQGITLDASGRALCDGKPGDCGDTGPDPNLYFQVIGSPGEPVRYMLATSDGKQRAVGLVVPVPLIGRDGGCSVELLRLLPNAELVAARARGFAPGEKLRISGTSHGEHHDFDATADAQGNWNTAL